MTRWEYTTIVMRTLGQVTRRWVIASPDPKIPAKQVGEAEKSRFTFISSLGQGVRLLETALKEMDAEGWELVSHSFSHFIFAFYGTAVLRRPASQGEEKTA